MPTISPFTPQQGGSAGSTVLLPVSAASATSVIALSGSGTQVRVLNNASVTVYIEFGASTISAFTSTGSVASSTPILSSAVPEKFTIPVGTVYAGVAASVATTGYIYLTRGEGF